MAAETVKTHFYGSSVVPLPPAFARQLQMIAGLLAAMLVFPTGKGRFADYVSARPKARALEKVIRSGIPTPIAAIGFAVLAARIFAGFEKHSWVVASGLSRG